MQKYQKTGYLNTDFKIFHLRDEGIPCIDSHFHDFHKILILLSGEIEYHIEGHSYILQPHDIVFVPAGEVHRPIVKKPSVYERIIIYISQNYLDTYSAHNADLSLCLKQAHQRQAHVLRLPAFLTSRPGQIMKELEHSLHSAEYANELYHQILFLEFMIQLNRAVLRGGIEYIHTSSSNQKIIDILNYLNLHLTEELNIDFLAQTFYISRYHLMHSFKEETGYTIGNYVTTKRLLLAKELIDCGSPITTACYECGFKNYSTFSRAYHKHFGCSPKAQLSIDAPLTYS